MAGDTIEKCVVAFDMSAGHAKRFYDLTEKEKKIKYEARRASSSGRHPLR